jgi:type I restriction enzyme S subunit
MKPYPAYKKSGYSWLGIVPEHWAFNRAKFIFKKMERPVREADEIITAFRDGQVTLRANRRVEGFTIALKEIGYQGIRKGDLVIHEMDGFAGAIGVSDSDGKSTPVYTVCTPRKEASTKYYAYLLRMMAYNGFIQSLAKGIRERSSSFSFNIFQELELPYFPLPEQQAIASFLDRKTAQIDRLIAKKQRQIELLQEQRTALINQAVTKGLNPDVPMKDSGIEWLGEIPSHWVMTTVRYFFDVKLGKMLDSSKQEEYELVKPYLRAANIHWNKILLDEVGVNKMGFTENQLERYLLQPGDLLVTEGGVTLGRSAIWSGELEECYFQNSLNRARPLKNITTKWLYYWMYFLTKNGYIDILSDKATFGHLTNEKLKALPIPIPPALEHAEIIAKVESFEPKVELQSAFINQQIGLLQEYRTALISEAVTGKIDVRTAG